MKAVVYCRVSTSGQAENGTSLFSQRDACLKLAELRGFHVPEEFVFLEDMSGADLDRPKLEKARELVRFGEANAFISYAVDRLARNPIHVGILAEEFAKREAELIFVLEPLDSSPEGALIRYVKGYAAQIERERIKERTIRGKKSRAKAGFMVQGTGRGIYGYRYVPENKKRAIYEPEAHVVRRIFESAAAGQSCHGIAVALNKDGIPALSGGLWHPLTIKRILSNPAFKGDMIYGRTRRVKVGKRSRLEVRNQEEWIHIPGATPAIVSEDLFQDVQEVLAHPRRNPTLASGKYLLTGFIECSCGAPVIGTTLNQIYRYYRCRRTWPTATRPKLCNAPYRHADALEEQAWRTICEVLQNPDTVVQELESQQRTDSLLGEDIGRLRGSIQRLADQEKRLVRLYGLANITEEYVVREAASVRKSREGLESDLERLVAQREYVKSLEGLGDRVRAFCQQATQRLDKLTFEERRLAFQSLGIRVVAGRDSAWLKGSLPTSHLVIDQDLATTERTSA